MADYLATNEFPGTGAVMQVEINFAGARLDLPGTPAPYFEDDDVHGQIVLKATETAPETVTDITLTKINNLTWTTTVVVPLGQFLRVYRLTDIEQPKVDFVSLQVVTENDLDTATRQTLYAVMEARDQATTAQDYANFAQEVAVEANAASQLAVERANAAVLTSDQAKTAADLAVTVSAAAESKSNQALDAAAAAEQHASDVEDLAQQAADSVGAAEQLAATANADAAEALETANGIDAKATQALTNSAAAVSTANAAASTANGIDAKATQALENASDAQADAAAAVATANGIDAKATQALANSVAAQASLVEAWDAINVYGDKLAEFVVIQDFLRALGEAPWTPEQLWQACTNAFEYCIANQRNLYFPAGHSYVMQSDRNFPFRNIAVAGLRDCRNITIFGDGPATVLQTQSVGGADVLQLNACKNLHFRNFSITSTQSGFAGAGSNGVSITDGWDNVTVKGVVIYDLPYIDKGTGADGGKGVTFQSDATSNECGWADIDVEVIRCVQGVGYEYKPTEFLAKAPQVRIKLRAEKCYAALTIGAVPATANIPLGAATGITADVTSRNCQHDLFLARVYGADIKMHVEANESAYNKIRRPDGVRWLSGDGLCYAVKQAGSHSITLNITGWKGACDSLFYYGTASAGSSNIPEYSTDNILTLGVSGAPSAGAFELAPGGLGLSLANSVVSITSPIVTAVPSQWVLPLARNEVHNAANVYGRSFTGTTVTATNVSTTAVATSQVSGVTSGAISLRFKDASGIDRLGITNGNGLAIDSVGSASALGTYVGKFPIYNMSGVLLGWFPLYN